MNVREVARARVVALNTTGSTRRTGRIRPYALRLTVRDETFGERLRRMREAAGLSQMGLADRINVVPSLLCYFEAGEKQPSVDTLILLADALGTTMDYLFRGRGEP